MHLQVTIVFPLFLACVTSGNPIHRGQGRREQIQPRGTEDFSSTPEVSPNPESSMSLEEGPGLYKFAPAPVWPRDAAPDPPANPLPLEEQSGPYHFTPAPVERRDGAPGPSTNSLPLEEQLGPYHFAPAPIWPGSAPRVADG